MDVSVFAIAGGGARSGGLTRPRPPAAPGLRPVGRISSDRNPAARAHSGVRDSHLRVPSILIAWLAETFAKSRIAWSAALQGRGGGQSRIAGADDNNVALVHGVEASRSKAVAIAVSGHCQLAATPCSRPVWATPSVTIVRPVMNVVLPFRGSPVAGWRRSRERLHTQLALDRANLGVHRLREREHCRARADHHGQLVDQPVLTGVEEVAPV